MIVERQDRRLILAGGAATTVHVVTYRAATPRVVRIAPEAPLEEWCAEHDVADAVSGGYSVKPEYEPLGELWVGGERCPHRPFRGTWPTSRGALAVTDGQVRIDHRDRLPPRPHALLQAGPLLVRDGRSAIAGRPDPEGFSSTSGEFDHDLTARRDPRIAIAMAGDRLLAVAADGRSEEDAGLTLWELSDLLVELGVDAALNLDGGSAGVIVAGARRVNFPRDDEGHDLDRSSPSVTAIAFSPRRSG